MVKYISSQEYLIKNQNMMINKYFITNDKNLAKSLNAVQVKNGYHIPYNLESLLEYKATGIEDRDLDSHIEYLQKCRDFEVCYRNKEHGNDIDERLRTYQVNDIHFMKIVPNPAMFNAPRTGKTPTSLLYTDVMGYQKVVIAVPSSTVLPWCNECRKWVPSVEPIVIKGTLAQRKKIYQYLKTMDKYVAIISYDTMKVDVNYFTESIDLLIVDEAHFLRNSKTKRSDGVKRVGFVAKHRMALTGTPAVRHASDVWFILNFLYPKVFTGFWQFAERYFKIEFDFFSGARQLGELKEERSLEFYNLVAHYCVQHKLEEVIDWLPEVIRYPEIVLDFEKIQAKQYQTMLDSFIAYCEEQKEFVEVPNTLSQLMRLRQIALDPSIIGLDGKSPKTDWIMSYIEDNPEEPIIIFSQFTSYLNKLHGKLRDKCVLFTGELSKDQKQKSIDDFQNGKVNVILVNIQAGGVGITLDRAVTEIFTDHVWSPHEREQAEARFLPTTKDKAKEVRGVYYLMMKDSVDYRLVDVMKHKDKSVVNVNDVINILKSIKEES